MKFKKTSTRPWNKKQAIIAFLNKFKFTFDIKDDAIDLREMAKNFPDEIIPLEEIYQGISTVLGPKYDVEINPYDPSTDPASPKFTYVTWDQLYLWSIFNRDVAPNHVEKIYKDFEHTAAIVPCAVKITFREGKLKGKTIYCIWDGHHTLQTMRAKGYTTFPIWYIDADAIPQKQIEEAGFGSDDAERIKYAAWLAGTNMRRINGKNKRQLAPYDDFMIGVDTRDAQYTAMVNILNKHNCVPKRHATCAGAFTQIKSGIECYELADMYGNKGMYWDRALNFHRTNWPGAPLTLEIFRPLSYLYHRANVEGFTLDANFDDELATMLINRWGDAESIQEGVKESFWNAYSASMVKGTIPEHDKERVLNGMINFYKQSGGKTLLPTPTCQWKV
jgi:hypothetical protein